MLNRNSVLVKVIGLVLLIAVVPLSVVFAQDDTMTLEEQNKEIVRTFLDGFDEADMAVIEEFVSPNYVDNSGAQDGMGSEMSAFEGLKMMSAMSVSAIPDFEIVILEMVAEGDQVAVLTLYTGTHEGDFMGMPATGNEVNFPVFSLYRLEDGLIVEHIGVQDSLTFLMQFGAIPMPEME
jgi:predicted ester cyclase